MKTLDFMIVAEVQFFPTSEGGRKGPTSPKVFGCIFEIDGDLFDCRLLLDDVGSISPGGRATVPIQFLFPELVKPKLSVGKEFYLKEGRRIAKGRIQQETYNDPSMKD